MAKKKTANPSGFSISRNEDWFTLNWKINSKNNNDGQKRRWRVNGGKWTTDAIGKTATDTKVWANVYPFYSMRIEIQDNQDKNKKQKAKDLNASSWKGATFDIWPPPNPLASMALDENEWNTCNVSFSHEGAEFNSSDHYWFTHMQCSTAFYAEGETELWEHYYHYPDQSGSFSKTEESSIVSDPKIGHVRKFAFRVCSKYGQSIWAYCSHYYSTPFTPIVKTAEMSRDESGGINCTMSWDSPINEFHPIDSTTVQYGIATPDINMSCPPDITWTDRPKMEKSPSGIPDGDSFYIDSTIGTDRCMFVRVMNIHDHNPAYSSPKLVTGIPSILSTPDNLSISNADYDTYRGIITVDNQSSVPDSNIAIVYHSIINGKADDQIIDIFPNGVSAQTVQFPNWDLADEWSFGAFAFVGDYGSYELTEDSEIVSGKKYYTRSGNGEPTFTEISSPTGNPHEKDYYELINDDYFISDDTTVISGKTYYSYIPAIPFTYTLVSNPIVSDIGIYYELKPNLSRETTFTVERSGTTYSFTYHTYEIPDIKMRSVTTWKGGDIPRAPEDVKAITIKDGVGLVTWDWAWKSADIAELAWSTHDDALESTDQPEMYRITNTHSGKWSIYGLDAGETWYIWVRLIKTTGSNENPGPWSSYAMLDMASAPNAPILKVSKKSVVMDDSFTISWEYNSTDGTDQKTAVLRSVTIGDNGELEYGDDIFSDIGTSRSIDITPSILGWESGQKYGFVLRVVSESGKPSDWSEPEFITVAEPLICTISSDSFENREFYVKSNSTELIGSTYYTVVGTTVLSPEKEFLYMYYELIDDIYVLSSDSDIDSEKTYYIITGTEVVDPIIDDIDLYYTRTETNILREMPIDIDIDVSGGISSMYMANITIERAASYFVDRPDETTYSGYEGEVVFSYNTTFSPEDLDDENNTSQTSTKTLTITRDDISGSLDDTAKYRVVVYVLDELDQLAEDYIDFTIDWAHQAAIPGAEVEFDPDYSVIKITPTIDPEKYETGDTFDIYRLSVDKPVLIVKGGTFGETYVDPYPTIGKYGGHRVVTVTANGDFIANDEEDDMAWIDLDYNDGDYFYSPFSIINYGEGSFEILYNADLSTNWTKDFKETKYLGGHIQGDWNAGIHRDSTINSAIIRNVDETNVTDFRRLAEYPGLCHIRSLDGSNYYADIQVTENIPSDDDPLNTYSFKITRVDSEGYDGIELSEWNKIISV